MQTWQFVLVGGLLTAAYFIDRELFAILAGVAAASAAFAVFHGRARARRSAVLPLRAALREVLDMADAGDESLRVHRGGRAVELAVQARPLRDGPLVGAVEFKASTGLRVPFCFVAQRRDSVLRLAPLVGNAAVFDTPLECELQPVPEHPLGHHLELMSSAPGGMTRLLQGDMGRPLRALDSLEAAELVSFSFDGRAVRALLAPAAAGDASWAPTATRAVGQFATGLDEGLRRLMAEGQ